MALSNDHSSRPLREEALDRLAHDSFDLLIAGGGIVGAGIARDAAMRGLRVALVDQHDFAFGTSSRTSRMLHGGLRYLSQGRVKLVREANREKGILRRIAPHLSPPLPFLFPAYDQKTRPLWQLKIGVKAYDLLCGPDGNYEPSRSMDNDEILEQLPGLNDRELQGAVRVLDGFTNDARLVLDTLRSASIAGAVVANYVQLQEATPVPSGWKCYLKNLESDQAFQTTVPVFINATGPWSDKLPMASIPLRRTKGIHLVVPHERLPVPEAVIVTRKDRYLFAIPWGERTILGSTDTDYDESLEEIPVTGSDIAYVLDVINEAFPSQELSSSDIVATWAGVRPLISSGGDEGPSNISRRHKIAMPYPGWLDLAGGKLTTYRQIAEETVDRVLDYLTLKAKRCPTAETALLPPSAVEQCSTVVPIEPTREQIAHYCRHEWAFRLEDVMVRRGGWHHYGKERLRRARAVADWMAEELDWPEEKKAEELSHYESICAM
jgi:glycerol-3-phosphate dehydrogenase